VTGATSFSGTFLTLRLAFENSSLISVEYLSFGIKRKTKKMIKQAAGIKRPIIYQPQ
jgi:hypothetical protein